jgi:hypothetical protein
VVLLKEILESIPVYWTFIAKVVKGILIKNRMASLRFWTGNKKYDVMPLVKWPSIFHTKYLGGWGIKNIYLFI